MRASLEISAGLSVIVAALGITAICCAQESSAPGTMRPVIRGQQAAVTSMKAEATEAARRILEAGGNAFDAAVGGQAALAVTDFASNGMGSDAMLLLEGLFYKCRTPCTPVGYHRVVPAKQRWQTPRKRRTARRRNSWCCRCLVPPSRPLGNDEL